MHVLSSSYKYTIFGFSRADFVFLTLIIKRIILLLKLKVRKLFMLKLWFFFRHFKQECGYEYCKF